MLEVEVALEQALLARLRERVGDVELVVVAEAGGQMDDLEAAVAELGRPPVERLDVRDADGVDRDDHDPLGERVGVLDVGAQRERRGVLVAAEEHGDAGNADQRRLLVARRSRNSVSGPSWATRLRVTTTWPRRQLIITIDSRSPIASGSQAPCSTFAMFALKNATSTVRNSTAIGASLRQEVPHSRRATARNSRVLRMNVPVTATP